MLRPSLACAVVAAVLAAQAPAALANAPAPYVRQPDRLGGAFVVAPTSLVVEREDLSFRCATASSCTFQAAYHVVNPGDAREEVLGAFYGIAAHGVTIRADGVDARRELTAEQRVASDAAVTAIEPRVVSSYGEALRRTGFTLAVEGHARAELVFEGVMEPVFQEVSFNREEFVIDAVLARHPWLSTESRDDERVEYAYALSPIRSWGGSPTIDVTVRLAGGLRWVPEAGWSVGVEDGGVVARRTLAARDASVLRFSAILPGTTLLNGGPFVAAGGRIGPAELRTRLGYEIAGPRAVLYSAAVETSFHGRTTLVPVIEAASPDLVIIIPSFGLGAGVPVQLRSGAPALVGVRGQLTVSFPVVSLVVPFDWFPGAAGGEQAQVAMLAQASF
ncbi:MAG TPA: hypothetical protein VHS09_14470 [Polyangiaceae bacterium]|nr:hypothetical protein [Polyangiaceae bacterium]